MTDRTRVIHVHDMPNYPDAIYVGRAMPRQGLKASKWANPHKIGRDGTRGEVIGQYWWDLVHGDKRHLLAQLPELRSRPLACWCRHDGEDWTSNDENGCHADVLVSLLGVYTDDELREMGGGDVVGG